MNVKIPICYNFNAPVNEDFKKFPDIYIPVGAGGFNSNEMKYVDSTDDNIS